MVCQKTITHLPATALVTTEQSKPGQHLLLSTKSESSKDQPQNPQKQMVEAKSWKPDPGNPAELILKNAAHIEQTPRRKNA